jgi:hypothetical protein
MTRLLLTIAVAVFFVACVAGMWWGWRNRGRRQAAYLPALPAIPDGPLGEELLPALAGVYVGTATAGDWQDRIVVGGLGFRATAEFRLYETGLLIDRRGGVQTWIPADAFVDARADKALAGKVMGIDGLLVVRWRLDSHELDSGLRADEPAAYAAWIDAIRQRTTADSTAEGERS